MEHCPQCGSLAEAGACQCGWRSAAALARAEQARLPLGGPDWREEVRASMIRHRQRRARLGGAAGGAGEAAGEAEKVVPFRRRPGTHRIPIVVQGASGRETVLAPTTAAPTAVSVALAPDAGTNIAAGVNGNAAIAPALPAAEPLAEPVVAPVMAPPPRREAPPDITLPLPFAAQEGHVEIAAPAPRLPPAAASAAPILAVTPAPPGLRWAAGMEDGLCALGLALAFLLAGWFALGMPAPPHYLGRTELRFAAALLAALPAFWFMVLIGASLTWGAATPGMRRHGLRLVDFDGRPAGRAARRRRVWVSLFSLGALGLGYLWMFLDPDELTWHDHLSGTIVTTTAEDP